MRSFRSALLCAVTVLAASTGVAFGQAAAGPPLPPALKLLGLPGPSQQVEFDIILPLRNSAALDALLAAQQNPTSPKYHHWLKPADFAAQFGAAQQTVQLVANVLQYFGLQAVPQSRSLHVTGTVAQVETAFNTSLAVVANATGQQRVVLSKALALPPSLSALGVIVSAFSSSGFDATPFVRQVSVGYVRQGSLGYVRQGSLGYASPANASSPLGGYFYNDLKQAYDYPSYQSSVTVNGKQQRLDGTGTTVAVLMAGDILDSDVSTLFDHENFTANSGQLADPTLFARRTVNGGATFSPSSPGSEEASVDVQQVLGGAPGSHVILYNTPDLSDQSLISGYTAIVNDNAADVVSLSFGQCEMYYTAAYNNGQDQTAVLRTFTELFKQGNAQGITFVAASGDAGGLGCISPGYFSGGTGSFTAGVSTPAADPNVTAVGGTNLVTIASLGIQGSSNPSASNPTSSSYVRENAFSDPELPFDPYAMGSNLTNGFWGAGGGVSSLYAKPSYQLLLNTGSSSYRTVPDVGMAMGGCPDVAVMPCNGGGYPADGPGNTDRSYVNVVFNGYWDSVIGTSVAAPEFASALALLVEAHGRQGNVNTYLYSLGQGQSAGGQAYFHQAIPGFNGLVANPLTYNFTTGNGTPDVLALLGMISAPAAAAPQSASNP